MEVGKELSEYYLVKGFTTTPGEVEAKAKFLQTCGVLL